mgnify:CR=1 FL=1
MGLPAEPFETQYLLPDGFTGYLWHLVRLNVPDQLCGRMRIALVSSEPVSVPHVTRQTLRCFAECSTQNAVGWWVGLLTGSVFTMKLGDKKLSWLRQPRHTCKRS